MRVKIQQRPSYLGEIRGYSFDALKAGHVKSVTLSSGTYEVEYRTHPHNKSDTLPVIRIDGEDVVIPPNAPPQHVQFLDS